MLRYVNSMFKSALWHCAKSHISWSARGETRLCNPTTQQASYRQKVSVRVCFLSSPEPAVREFWAVLCTWKWTVVVQLCTFHTRLGGETACGRLLLIRDDKRPQLGSGFFFCGSDKAIAWDFATYTSIARRFLRLGNTMNLTYLYNELFSHICSNRWPAIGHVVFAFGFGHPGQRACCRV
jgi:hypothetical protein